MYDKTIEKISFGNASTITYFQNNGTESIPNPFDDTFYTRPDCGPGYFMQMSIDYSNSVRLDNTTLLPLVDSES